MDYVKISQQEDVRQCVCVLVCVKLFDLAAHRVP